MLCVIPGVPDLVDHPGESTTLISRLKRGDVLEKHDERALTRNELQCRCDQSASPALVSHALTEPKKRERLTRKASSDDVGIDRPVNVTGIHGAMQEDAREIIP